MQNITIDPSSISVLKDQLFTTSLDISNYFDKRHDNILRKIYTLDCSDEFNRLNFEVVKHIDEKGEERTSYKITKDGFMFLAMGFTGAKAAMVKEAYINAFNTMQEKLLNKSHSVKAIEHSDPIYKKIISETFTNKSSSIRANATDVAYILGIDKPNRTQLRNIGSALNYMFGPSKSYNGLKKYLIPGVSSPSLPKLQSREPVHDINVSDDLDLLTVIASGLDLMIEKGEFNQDLAQSLFNMTTKRKDELGDILLDMA